MACLLGIEKVKIPDGDRRGEGYYDTPRTLVGPRRGTIRYVCTLSAIPAKVFSAKYNVMVSVLPSNLSRDVLYVVRDRHFSHCV